MKSLTITLLVALFCVAVSGVKLKDTAIKVSKQETKVSDANNFEYNFEINRHVKKGTRVPTNG